MKSGNKTKIVVAMSGGVDSSVAAALLKKQGYDVIGVFMKFWTPADVICENRCCSSESEKRARQVAKKLNIPFYVINAEREFKKKVVDYFLKEYKSGRTPNPCVVCNKEIKFGLLIEKALKLGADFVATGHYARIKNNELLRGRDKNKDQSYFLWQLNQKQLSHILFPVGEYTKPEVRVLAKKFNLPTAETPESQEICFAPALPSGRQNTANEFLKRYLKTKSGKIIDKNKKVLGEHQGLWFYTIGQRKGIGLSGGPYFVIAKDFKKNNLIVSKNPKDLENKKLIAKNVNWLSGEYAEFCDRRIRRIGVYSKEKKLPLDVEVKIRYKSNLAKAKIITYNNRRPSLNKVRVIFTKPQRAITPGQSVVFYKGEQLLGGGIIE